MSTAEIVACADVLAHFFDDTTVNVHAVRVIFRRAQESHTPIRTVTVSHREPVCTIAVVLIGIHVILHKPCVHCTAKDSSVLQAARDFEEWILKNRPEDSEFVVSLLPSCTSLRGSAADNTRLLAHTECKTCNES